MVASLHWAGQLCASKPLAPMQSTAPPVKASEAIHHQREAASFWWVCAAPLSGLWVCASGRQLQPGSGSVAPHSRPPQPQNPLQCYVPCLSAPAFEPRARGPPVGRVDAAADAAIGVERPFAAACDACVPVGQPPAPLTPQPPPPQLSSAPRSANVL